LLFSETDGIDNCVRVPTLLVGCNRKGKNDLRSVATCKKERIDYIEKDTSMVTTRHINLFFNKKEKVANDQYIHIHCSLSRWHEYELKEYCIACCEFNIHIQHLLSFFFFFFSDLHIVSNSSLGNVFESYSLYVSYQSSI
jgi:hypothetical protein